ncbi:MAG: phosphopantetheine-binding protein [Clostridia bacterium]
MREIKRVIASHPQVAFAAVFCRGTASDTFFLSAALTKADDDMDLDDVQNYVRANLPSYMIPAQYYIVDSIPLNANGKIDRKQLERLLPNFSFTPASQPVTEEESELIWLWKDLLRMQDIGPDDSFFEIGGNSALVLQLFTRLQDRYKSLQISDLFSYHTPRMFIQHMQAQRAQALDAQPERTQENAYEILLENMLCGNIDKARGMDAIKERGLNG